MGGDILFLAHRLPFPPDRGDRIRSCNVLKALAKIAPVHVGCFVDDDADRAHTAQLAEVAKSWCVVKRAKPLALAGLESLIRREPVSLSAFRSDDLSRWVEKLLASGRIAAVYVFSGQMGQFVPASWQGRLVVDLVDVDSAKFGAYAEAAAFPQSMIHAREGELLSRVEAQLAGRADHTLLVSEDEADLLRSRAGDVGHITSIGNGIDSAFFDPEGVTPSPDMAGEGPHFLFTGQMDYPPNVSAVERMTKRIMPEVFKTLPQAQFHIVGRAPARAVEQLHGLNGTQVWGAVPDMRNWLAAADVVVAPLTIARGIQNKVLEAMAMARPVVASPEAATGIAAHDDIEFAIAGSDEEFAARLLQLGTDPEAAAAMGKAARKFVIEKQGWDAMLEQLPDLLGYTGQPGGGPRCRLILP